jgi:hypothetical protein
MSGEKVLMEKSKYKILVISGGMVHKYEILSLLVEAGYSTYLFATDFIEAFGMIEKHRPNVMILDLSYFGFRCIDGKLRETKFATYVWNKYGIPHVYISPASKFVWKEIRLNESRPLAIVKRPICRETLINVMNNAFGDSDGRANVVAKLRRRLTKGDKNLIRLATKMSKDSGEIAVDSGPCTSTVWSVNSEGAISNVGTHEYYSTVYHFKSKKAIQ